ncbi:hypothetical protein SynMITS9220_02695 [Synechococcus sp. MIT S9220]|nr:hypothetical protein SynMITS9220_02695 [Synechococcus sp. MIT S9220]
MKHHPNLNLIPTQKYPEEEPQRHQRQPNLDPFKELHHLDKTTPISQLCKYQEINIQVHYLHM